MAMRVFPRFLTWTGLTKLMGKWILRTVNYAANSEKRTHGMREYQHPEVISRKKQMDWKSCKWLTLSCVDIALGKIITTQCDNTCCLCCCGNRRSTVQGKITVSGCVNSKSANKRIQTDLLEYAVVARGKKVWSRTYAVKLNPERLPFSGVASAWLNVGSRILYPQKAEGKVRWQSWGRDSISWSPGTSSNLVVEGNSLQPIITMYYECLRNFSPSRTGNLETVITEVVWGNCPHHYQGENWRWLLEGWLSLQVTLLPAEVNLSLTGAKTWMIPKSKDSRDWKSSPTGMNIIGKRGNRMGKNGFHWGKSKSPSHWEWSTQTSKVKAKQSILWNVLGELEAWRDSDYPTSSTTNTRGKATPESEGKETACSDAGKGLFPVSPSSNSRSSS